MIIFPAIDLYGGRVVRLTEGDFCKRSEYEVSPIEAAKKFLDAGCTHLHIVDLEGAKLGRPCHLNVLRELAELGMFIEYGGGLRTLGCVREAAEAGAQRLMVGSLIFKDPEMPHIICREFGAAAMAAIDVRAGRVVHSGWLEGTDLAAEDAVKSLHCVGFSTFLVTDTERDGQMRGIRTEIYRPLVKDGIKIVAAGGVTGEKDIRALAELGISGAVVGKSLYEGGINIKAALAAAGSGV